MFAILKPQTYHQHNRLGSLRVGFQKGLGFNRSNLYCILSAILKLVENTFDYAVRSALETAE